MNPLSSKSPYSQGRRGAFLKSFCFTLLLAVGSLWGLDPHKAISQYVHTVWRSEDGLPQNSVQALLQTSDGYLWMGTQDGLVRFNGIQFTVYTKANVDAFKHNDTRALFQDADGTLWVGMFGGGLVRYKDGRFTAYSMQNGLSNNFVSSILRDHNGSLWIGTNDGLNEFSGTGFRRFGINDGLSDNTIQALAEDAEGHLLVATKRGLDRLGEHKEFVRFSASIPARDSFMALLRDQKNDLWVGTENHGLYRLSPTGVAHYDLPQGLPRVPISTIYQDANGTIWVGTNGSGMCRARNERLDSFECYGPKDGLSGNNVESIIQDREGNLWVGTETGGVDRFKEGALSNYGMELGIKGSPRTVFEAPDGGLWIGTNLGLWHVKDGKAAPYMAPGPLGNYVYSMFQDHAGHVWTGTSEGGLNEFIGHQVKTYTVANGLADNFVPALFVDRAGDVWAGTGGGVSRIHQGKIINYTTKEGLGSNRVWAVQQDHKGDLWFGTDIGLSRLHDGKFTNYNLLEVAADGSGLGSVMVIYEDADHAFWIGTYGSGLKLFKDGKFTTISIKEGLFDDTLWSILEDSEGNFWMSSNRGIFRVKKSELIDFAEGRINHVSSPSYGTSDGMASSECNGGSQYSAWKRKNGELLFACLRSVVAVDPRHLPINTLAPPVVIEKVKINRDEGVIAGAKIAAGAGELDFQYAALSYFAPEKVAFKCKLEGFEKDWIVPPTPGLAHYTNIPPGHYTFRVIAANNDGVWNDSGAVFSFYLEPRFYQTPWFYSFCGLILLLSAGGIYFLRILRIRRTEQELVVLVDKRTHELQSAKELAEAATRAKGDFVANMSHEIRTPLNGVMGMLDLIAQSELTGDQKQLLTMAQDSANSLLVVINDVLDFSKIEAGKLVFDIQEFDLAETVAEEVRTMALRAHQKGLELAYQVDPTIPQFLMGDAGRIKQVLTNLIGNAIKFTEKGEVVLRASVEQILDDTIHLHFAVTDTGIGVPPEKQQLIFEAFSQADASTTRKFGGTGLGLAICSRIVELMGGKIWIESNAGHGSTFVFTARLDIAAKSQQGQMGIPGVDLEGVPTLIVDDNRTNRFILEQMLFAWGLKITAVDSADGALRAMREALRQGRPYKLVLTDNHMPGMDGFELVQRMKESPDLATAAVMMLTSDDYHDSARRCRNMGIDSHLIKPVKQSELLAVIRKVLAPSHDVEQGPPPVLAVPSGKLLVLLAEDNLVNQRLAVRLLERMGHEVVVAQTGREALDKFRNNAFDLVLMDVQMPEMDGFAATEAIRKWEHGRQKHVPVIAMTAHAMKGDRESCLEAGMDGYIAKPASREELQQAIEAVMKASVAAS